MQGNICSSRRLPVCFFPLNINLQILRKTYIIVKKRHSHHQCSGTAGKVITLLVKWNFQPNRLPSLSDHASHHSIYDKRFIILELLLIYGDFVCHERLSCLTWRSGAEDSVLGQLRKIGVVEEAYVSYGVYDLIIKVKADTMEELKEAVTRQIRTVNQVRSTLTLIMMEE